MDDNDRSRTSSARQQASGGGSSAGDPHSSAYGGQPYNTPISYQSDYSPDPQSRQPSYQSSAYTSNVVYNPIQQTNSQYTSMQQYPGPRHQTAAIEVLSSQFSGAPQPYYGGNDSPIASAVTPHSHHPPTSQFSSPSYSQYSPAAQRPALSYSATPDLQQQQPPTSEPPVEEEAGSQQNSPLDEAYAQYQNALKRTFINMRDGRLGEAGASLLTISDWLLSNAVELGWCSLATCPVALYLPYIVTDQIATGLVRDEEALHAERTKLWNEFNTCWLSVLQKQKEMLQDYLATGQEPQPPQELLREDFLERMGREIIRLCDNMEPHGLVDYQMGVWEEEIVDGESFDSGNSKFEVANSVRHTALTECLDLLETINAPQHSPQNAGAV